MYLLIDGDILRYQVGFAYQTITYLVTDDEGNIKGEFYSDVNLPEGNIVKIDTPHPWKATNSLDSKIQEMLKAIGASSYRVFLSEGECFRSKIAKTKPYKGNRTGERPILYGFLTDYLIREHYAEVVIEIEADDAIGIAQTAAEEGTTCIASIDKDLNMIPGWHYNLNTGVKYWVTEEDAWLWFCCQMIIGDTVDNIQGIPGKGKMAAYHILKNKTNWIQSILAVETAYEKYFGKELWEEKFNEHRKLLWILRDGDKIPI